MRAPPVLDERPVSTAVRTLLASGFHITGSTRRPRYIIIDCEKLGLFGITSRYAIAVTDADEFLPDEREDVQSHATFEHRNVVFVAAAQGDVQFAWDEFLDALGGGVPSWRALSDSYRADLLELARNRIPEGVAGEAWRLFEEAVADGLEFVLGKRVQRLGGLRRGTTVSDMIVQLPSGEILVVDAKAAKNGFDASWPNLRALGEYVRRQIARQRGQNRVFGALVVSSCFDQNAETLRETSLRFNAEFQTPVALLGAEDLEAIIEIFRGKPQLRNALRWNHIFAGGLVDVATVRREIDDAERERFPAGDA